MKGKLMDILSLIIMCLVFILMVKILVLLNGEVNGNKMDILGKLVKALSIRRI